MVQRVWSGRPVDGKLDGRPPLIYCRDERSAALGVLQWIAQTL